MFDKTRQQINNRRWDNPHTFGDQVDCSNPQTTNSEKVERTGERLSWYGSNDPRAQIEPPSCRKYKPGDILATRALTWDETIEEDDDDDNWVDPRVPSSGRSRPSDGNGNDDGKGKEEDMQGSGKGTGKEKGTQDGKGKQTGKWKGKGKRKGMAMKEGKGKGNGKGKGIVTQTPGGEDISHAVALQLQKEMYKADSDMEG